MNNSQTALSITTPLLRDPLHPFPCYRELREHYPVYYSAEFRSWFVTCYHDVQRVIADPLLFSSEQTIRRRAKPTQTNGSQSAPTLLWIDPPRHRQLRSLINQAFTPRTIANLAPRVTTIVHAHIDAIILCLWCKTSADDISGRRIVMYDGFSSCVVNFIRRTANTTTDTAGAPSLASASWCDTRKL